jgi:hypothetical protein
MFALGWDFYGVASDFYGEAFKKPALMPPKEAPLDGGF